MRFQPYILNLSKIQFQTVTYHLYKFTSTYILLYKKFIKVLVNKKYSLFPKEKPLNLFQVLATLHYYTHNTYKIQLFHLNLSIVSHLQGLSILPNLGTELIQLI